MRIMSSMKITHLLLAGARNLNTLVGTLAGENFISSASKLRVLPLHRKKKQAGFSHQVVMKKKIALYSSYISRKGSFSCYFSASGEMPAPHHAVIAPSGSVYRW